MADWTEKQHNQAVKTMAVVCEVTGSQLSEAAIAMVVRQVQRYPFDAVIRALERCANECKRGLTLADIVERIDDGRPSVEEAWARVPKDEYSAAVMCDEMLIAWGAASQLYASGDHVAARMAFKEVYEREIRNARAAGEPAKWILSAGWDRMATEAAALDGVKAGQITFDHATQLLAPEAQDRLAASLGIKALPAPESNTHQLAAVKELVDKLSIDSKRA